MEGTCNKATGCQYSHAIARVKQLDAHVGSIVKDVAVWESPVGLKIFTGSHEGCWKLWETTAWMEESNVAMEGKVHCMILEGSWLFCGFEAVCPLIPGVTVGMIRAWNLAQPAAVPVEFKASDVEPFAHSQFVQTLVAGADPQGHALLFSGSEDGTIRVWNYRATTNTFALAQTLYGHVRGVTSLKLNMAVGLLFSGSMDHSVRVWQLATMQCSAVLTVNDAGHSGPVTDLMLWDHEGASYLISCSMDQSVKVWSAAPQPVQQFSSTESTALTCLAGTLDKAGAPLLLLGELNGNIVIRELPTFELKTTISAYCGGHGGTVRRILAGPGNTFLSAAEDGKVLVWEWTGAASTM